MPHTHTAILYHLVFSTKDRVFAISDPGGPSRLLLAGWGFSIAGCSGFALLLGSHRPISGMHSPPEPLLVRDALQ